MSKKPGTGTGGGRVANIYLPDGPSKWHEQYPVANGERQSPINIVTEKTVYDKTLSKTPLKAVYNNNCCDSVTNTGNSFQVNVSGAGTELSGGPLNGTYELLQFHGHWGPYLKTEGSEHTVDGKTYPAELHLVHWNIKYKSVSEAMKEPDGLAVIAVFLKRGHDHPGFARIEDLFLKIPHKGRKVDIEFRFDPTTLLPAHRDYWTYPGSLTTPPLYESVTWIVMKDPIEVSVEQIAALRNLLWDTPSGEAPMYNNYRPPQPLNGRKVRANFTEGFGSRIAEMVPNWAWGAMFAGVGAASYALSQMGTPNYRPGCARRIVNDGHTFKIEMRQEHESLSTSLPGQITGDSDRKEDVPKISGGPLHEDYKLLQIHAHWGGKDDQGSEHTVDGQVYQGEVHLVHMNTKYPSFEQALTKRDGLAVLGVFLQLSDEGHESFQTITDMLDNVSYKGDSHELDDNFNPQCLIPEDHQKYWSYPGSLTTGGYQECVIWIIYKNTLKVSHQQLEVLRSLKSYPREEDPNIDQDPATERRVSAHILDNYRPIQPLHKRRIRASFPGNNYIDTCQKG
ncbi:PREDICTED: uncharacterized protein LOC109473311 [Branchiostoma belcheri]|uniref:Carbonic anhydrase n=1 Tax=Branchiostoma belcheri TaxID=7741 RepID=A0A6P4ZGF4_BRABE|nr:PREDICTED: uncharacterized protein LOC109473311 [Branchiostoma belcheri]